MSRHAKGARMQEAEVYETGSGLAVVTEDAESVRTALREQRRAKNRLRRQRAAQRRSGGSKGMSTWRARAKHIGKLERQVKRDHPEADARQTAKTAVKIGEDITRMSLSMIVHAPVEHIFVSGKLSAPNEGD